MGLLCPDAKLKHLHQLYRLLNYKNDRKNILNIAQNIIKTFPKLNHKNRTPIVDSST